MNISYSLVFFIIYLRIHWSPCQCFSFLSKNFIENFLITGVTFLFQVLREIAPSVTSEGVNPLSSLQFKQTPYEPDHVWALNSYAIIINNQ